MPKLSQKTLKDKIELQGVGLHNGIKVNLTLKPSRPNTGIVFKRVDIKDNNINQCKF